MSTQANPAGRAGPRRTSRSARTEAGSPCGTRSASLDVAGLPWLHALQQLMGFQAEHGRTGAYFAWGLRESRLTWGDLRVLAGRVKRDVVFLEFVEPAKDAPPNIVLATHARKGVELSEDCELWVLNSWKNVEILTPKRRFVLDDDGRLKGRANTLDEMRARRVELTHARWQALAAELRIRAGYDETRGREIPLELFEPQADAAD